MDRRSFLTKLVGGIVAAGSLGMASAHAKGRDDALPAAMAEPVANAAGIDETDAEFAHMPPGPRWRGHRQWHQQRRAMRRRRRRRRWRWYRGRRQYY